MSNHFPIPSPPEELLEQWQKVGKLGNWQNALTLAYRAGADQELEACCLYLERNFDDWDNRFSAELRAARRQKPPSLNKVALQMLGTIERDAHYIPEITDTIRRALEALDD